MVNFKREWRYRDPLAAILGKGEHIGGSTLDPDGGQQVATRACVRPLQNAVSEDVAVGRLHEVGKVADKDRM